MDIPRGSVLKCDEKGFTKGWYRFAGYAGSGIANKCTAADHCGTKATGWMEGSHPTEDEGIVTRKVCYSYRGKCCYKTNNLRVRNCGDFYVYQLDKVPSCHLGYCGDGKGKSDQL